MARRTLEDHLRIAAKIIRGNIMTYKMYKADLNERDIVEILHGQAWQIGQTIFPINNPSGKMSVEARQGLIDGTLTRSQLCKEHFHPRVQAGIDILLHFEDIEIDMDVLIEMIRKYSQTHLVLKEQNMALKKLNSRKSNHPLKSASWQKQYKYLKIILVDAIDMRRFNSKKALAA